MSNEASNPKHIYSAAETKSDDFSHEYEYAYRFKG